MAGDCGAAVSGPAFGAPAGALSTSPVRGGLSHGSTNHYQPVSVPVGGVDPKKIGAVPARGAQQQVPVGSGPLLDRPTTVMRGNRGCLQVGTGIHTSACVLWVDGVHRAYFGVDTFQACVRRWGGIQGTPGDEVTVEHQ